MQPLYLYNYYRKMTNPSLDDTPYINEMIEESINDESNLIKSYNYMINKESNKDNIKEYQSIIYDSKTHIKLLQTIYGNINNKSYEQDIQKGEAIANIKDIIFTNVELNKKLRKLYYSMRNNIQRAMIFDIIIDNINNNIILTTMMHS